MELIKSTAESKDWIKRFIIVFERGKIKWNILSRSSKGTIKFSEEIKYDEIISLLISLTMKHTYNIALRRSKEGKSISWFEDELQPRLRKAKK